MRDFNMTHGQICEMKRHFNYRLSFNSVSDTNTTKNIIVQVCTPKKTKNAAINPS